MKILIPVLAMVYHAVISVTVGKNVLNALGWTDWYMVEDPVNAIMAASMTGALSLALALCVLYALAYVADAIHFFVKAGFPFRQFGEFARLHHANWPLREQYRDSRPCVSVVGVITVFVFWFKFAEKGID